MKKTLCITLLLMLICVFALWSCDKADTSSNDDNGQQTTEEADDNGEQTTDENDDNNNGGGENEGSSDTPAVCQHTFGDWTTVTEATCKEEGKRTKTCSKCAETVEESIQKSETHTPVTDAAVPATCNKTGLTEGSHCSVCDEVLVEQTTVPKTENHTPVTDAAVAATCKKTGLTEGSHCGECGEVIVPQGIVPITNSHIPSQSVTENKRESTCTVKGSYDSVVYCSVCQKEISRNTQSIPFISHEYKNNACIYCKAPQASVGLSYTSNGDGTCRVSGKGSFDGDHLVIPEKAPNGDTVVAIDDSAFYAYTYLFSVSIPDTVERIGDYAFAFCWNLRRITLPNGLAQFGESVFDDCDNIHLAYNENKGVCYLGSRDNPYLVLMEPSDKTKATYEINENTVFVNNHAFSYCQSLTSLVIPNSVKSIGHDTFQYCINLTSITLPKNLTVINSSTFYGCEKLESIDIPSNVTTIGSLAFSSCKGLKTVTLPDKVVSIGNGAFEHCTNMEEINLPESITVIEGDAFRNCSSLKSMVIPKKVKVISGGLFIDCTALETIILPDGVTSIEGFAFKNCSSLKSIVIPKSVISIKTDMLQYCMKLESVEFENTEGWRYYSLISDTVGTELDVSDPSENAQRLMLPSNLGYGWKRS